MSHIIENCTLQIDSDRGIIWVHSPDGYTVLRLCSLPTPVPLATSFWMLDITGVEKANWGADFDSEVTAVLEQLHAASARTIGETP